VNIIAPSQKSPTSQARSEPYSASTAVTTMSGATSARSTMSWVRACGRKTPVRFSEMRSTERATTLPTTED
jgi:hypothetical protein